MDLWRTGCGGITFTTATKPPARGSPFMTQLTSRLVSRLALAAVLGLAASSQAFAQATPSDDPEPWRNPSQGAPPAKPHATSSLEATKPTAADQRQSRALAAAVFSRPAAAHRAADKASAANTPPIPPTDPKPEWLGEQGVHFGGEGVQVSKPF
jgi:hypothetical protein